MCYQGGTRDIFLKLFLCLSVLVHGTTSKPMSMSLGEVLFGPQKPITPPPPTLRPPQFPLHIDVSFGLYENWSGEIRSEVWYATPQDAGEVLEIVNWAMQQNYKVRPCGKQRSWAPLTVQDGLKGRDNKVILVKTTPYLNAMGIISNQTGSSSFWAEPGVLLDDLLPFLGNHGLSFAEVPSSGDVSLGGILATGGHGNGIPAIGETQIPGHTYGTLSNTIMAFTAIVYDPIQSRYVLKEFQRDRDGKSAAAFLTSLGRAFLTNVTMRVGPKLNYRLLSLTNITADDLFALEGNMTFSKVLDYSGRAEVDWITFTQNAWLKVWKITEEKPKASLELHKPYPFEFQDVIDPGVKDMIHTAYRSLDNMATAQTVGKETFDIFQSELDDPIADVWGPAQNTLLHLKASTLEQTATGYVVITHRKNIQTVLSKFYNYANKLMKVYSDNRLFPLNGLVRIYITGLDNSDDVLMDGTGALPPIFSPLRPVAGKDWDIAIHISMDSAPGSSATKEFFSEMEAFFFETFNNEWATARVQWSQVWAYCDRYGAWATTSPLVTHLKFWGMFEYEWDDGVQILDECDPFNIFKNSLHSKLFQRTSS